MGKGNNIKGEEEFNSDSKFSNEDLVDNVCHRELYGKEGYGPEPNPPFPLMYKCELCEDFFFTFSPGVEWKEVDGEEVLLCPEGHPMVKWGDHIC